MVSYQNHRADLVEPGGIDYHFLPKGENHSVAAVKPAASNRPPDGCTEIGSIPLPAPPIRGPPTRGGPLIGGAGGNRTPVRRQLGRNFSGRSLLFTFPHPGGNKHPTGISSFIMHGTRKALRTHVLHSNHTRARLVDLPGRMRA